MSLFHPTLLECFLNSEIPLGSNLLLIGPPGAGKTVFCENVICEAAKNKTKIMYVTLDHSPKDVLRRNSQLVGNPVTDSGCPTFVDGYSWLVGESNEQYHVGSLSNLSELSVKIISASNELGEGAFFVFDSISTLLVYNPENEVARFLEVNMARMKHINNVGLWTIEQGIHSESFYNMLRHMTDGVLEIRLKEDDLKRFIRMHSFRGISHSTEWRSFTVSKDGLFVLGEVTHL